MLIKNRVSNYPKKWGNRVKPELQITGSRFPIKTEKCAVRCGRRISHVGIAAGKPLARQLDCWGRDQAGRLNNLPRRSLDKYAWRAGRPFRRLGSPIAAWPPQSRKRERITSISLSAHRLSSIWAPRAWMSNRAAEGTINRLIESRRRSRGHSIKTTSPYTPSASFSARRNLFKNNRRNN